MARLPFEAAAVGGLSTPIWTWPVDAAAAWVRGAVVIDDGSGELVEGGADPTLIAGIATSTYPPTNNYATDVGKFIPALPGQLFEGSIDNNGDLGNGVTTATMLGESFGITQDSAGIWYVDVAKTVGAGATAVRVRLAKFVDPAATVQGRVRFVFLSVIDVGGTPTIATLWAGT